MQTHSSKFGRHGGRFASFGFIVCLLAFGSLWPSLASAQHTSSECPAQTATVSAGGTVTIDITDCQFASGFGGVGTIDGGSSFPPAPNFEDHGTATTRLSPTGSQWFLDYSHNGTTGIGSTDVFEISDGSLSGIGDVLVTITITASASPITVSPASLSTLTAGTPFSQTLTSAGGLAPYTYALQSGALPVGLSLTGGGVLSGTPTQRGAYSFSVRSTDSTSPTAQFVDRGYTGTVQNPSLALNAASGTAIQSVAFSQTLSVTGGVAPYTFQLETGSFPAGISVSSGGVISGTTAAAPGNYPVTIRVTDASTGPGSYFEVENFTLTVSPPPSVSVAVSPASVSEDGATNLTYTVTRSLNISSPTTVNITTSGTATSGTDYTGGVATVVIPAGATTATITIDPSVDGSVEANETAILTVAAGTGYTVGVPSSATGTILNDDAPSATISVSPASVSEDGAPNLVFTVTLNQASLSATSVGYTIGGTATNGTDYATISSPLVIPAGSTTGTVTVNPTADATIESNETVILTLSAGAGYTVGVPSSATGTILNDDLPNLTINDVTANEGNAGTTNFTFTVSLSAPAGPGGVNFDIATANGSATAGVDYVASSLTSQTIPAGSSTYIFTVLVNGDTLNEPSETFFVNVTNVTNAVVVDGQGVGTIVNDDPLPSLSINDVTVTEGNSGTTNAVFTVTLSTASGQTVGVNYATADGTATQPADYTNTSGTLTFTPGQTTRTITVPVVGEAVAEANEAFFVNLSGATNATIADNQGLGTITNDDVPVTVGPGSLTNGTVAAAYSQTVTASGGVAPYTFTVSAGALPAGLTLSSGGALSGTPTAGGTFNFSVSATDSSPLPGPFSGTRAYTVTMAPPTIVLPVSPLAGGTLGAAYSAAITAASGGNAPYAYAVTAGALPGGLTLNAATGAITGTPSALGTFNFSVTATDSSTGTGPYTATRAYSIGVIDLPPGANSSSLTIAYNAAATNVPLNITGGAPTSVAIATPAGNGTAIATGTTITYQPTAGFAGNDTFTYTVTNSGGTSAPATVTVTVNDPVVTISVSGGFAATVSAAYSQTFTFNGGAQPWSGYQVTNLPAGLSITGTTVNSVTISGTPTQAGSFTLNASATDSSTGNGPYSVGQAFTLTVSAPTLSLTPAATTFTPAYATPFSQSFTAAGGIGPYTYAVTGTLPTGLTLTGNSVSGTPTQPGNYVVLITATDTGSTGAGSPFSIGTSYGFNVAAPTIVVNPASLPNPQVGAAYSETVTATGGIGPYSFTVTAGALPAGLSLSSLGVLSGTPTAGGTFNFTVTASDTHGQTASRAYAITPAASTITLPAVALAGATFGTPYTAAITPATGGTAPYSYSVTAGALPGGLTLTPATGAISGTPTAAGTFNFSLTATDSSTGTGPYSASQGFSIVSGKAAQTITFAKPADVTFQAGGTVILIATASSGLPVAFASTSPAVCTVAGTTMSMVSPGNCSITASQAGNDNYAAATPVAQTFGVDQMATTTTLTSSANPVSLNQPFTLTAVVSLSGGSSPGAGNFHAQASVGSLGASVPLSGTVTFTSSTATLCSNVALSNGVATCTASISTSGEQTLTATYNGGVGTARSTSNVVAQTVVNQAARTAEAIGRFLGARNNQILSNEPDANRQIDRLIEAGGQQGGQTGQGAGFATGRGVGDGGHMPSRLGDGPDGTAISRMRLAGGPVRSLENSFSNPFAGDRSTAPWMAGMGGQGGETEGLPGINQYRPDFAGSNTGSGQLGGLRFAGTGREDTTRFAFATSLRDMTMAADAAEKQKLAASGLAYDGARGAAGNRHPNPFDVWVEGKYTSFRDSRSGGDLDGQFGLMTLGADYVVNPSLLVGVVVQFDHMQQLSTRVSTEVSGHGWMVGPYATLRLSENVFWQGRTAWGQSSNTVSPFLTYVDRFDTDRWMAGTSLLGRWTYGAWSFRPSASVAYIEDTAQSYADTFGVVIPSIKASLGQAKAGPEFSYRFEFGDAVVIPHVGLQAIWNFAGGVSSVGSGPIGDDAAGPEGVRGRVELGVTATIKDGVGVDFSGSYDGLGADGYSAVTGRAAVRVPLN